MKTTIEITGKKVDDKEPEGLKAVITADVVALHIGYQNCTLTPDDIKEIYNMCLYMRGEL